MAGQDGGGPASRYRSVILRCTKAFWCMTGPRAKPIAVRQRCDGRRRLFDIVDNRRNVDCAISVMALEDSSESRRYKPADQLKSLALARQQIEIIALGRTQDAGPRCAQSAEHLSNDVDDLPSTTG
jgi:hypothetical protein